MPVHFYSQIEAIVLIIVPGGLPYKNDGGARRKL